MRRTSGQIIFLAAVMVCFVASGSRAGEDPPPPGHLIHRSIPPPGARTHTVVLGERFRAGGFHKWLYGRDYRDLWNTPIQVKVLDLDTVAGGLKPVGTGGFGQSISLHLAGKDGRPYSVRSLDKDPTKRLWGELKQTFVEDILQDQISAMLPTGGLVVDRLMEATGILHAKHTLVVIPDHPRLGDYRREFAGFIGAFQEYPVDGADETPGFAGSRSVKGSERLWADLEAGPEHRVNARAFLKARLLDILINDKDRHFGQWRWARFADGEGYFWYPIPEDRDQAFVDFDGFAMFLARRAIPKQIRFEARYPSVTGLTTNGWELDREYLSELERSVWDSMTTALQRELPDAVIEDAVRRLPPPFYDQVGDFLTRTLKTRRNILPAFVDRYYRLITRQAEVRATDKDEYILFEHKANGDLALQIGQGGADPDGRRPPYFRRTYHHPETKEIRLYAHGGDDCVEVSGGNGRINILADGGDGDDTFVNTSEAGSGKTRFFDASGKNRFEKGRGAKVNERPYKRPPGTTTSNSRRWLDWGSQRITLPVVSASPDLGIYGGVISSRQHFGYRRDPYSSKHSISLGVASEGAEPFVAYTGAFRHVWPGVDGSLHLEYSGINVIRFNGFGNDTQIPESTSFYKVEQKEFRFTPGLVFRAGKHPGPAVEGAYGPGAPEGPKVRTTLTISVGPIAKYADTPLEDNSDRYISSLPTPPYGTGSFGQIGARGQVEIDTRNNLAFPGRGFLIDVSGAVYPEAWDVAYAFGHLEGEISTYLSAGGAMTLALRGGGKNVWGRFPFHEAAFVGGPGTLRGFRKDRFGGESSVYGNAELRLRLSRIRFLLPGEFGVFGGIDTGRVFLDADPSDADKFHTGVGGGIWLSFLQRTQTLSVAFVNGDDLTGFYLRAGFMF